MAVLFVGNGINRLEDISVSWDKLLEKLYSEPTWDISNALGMTMRYEYIDCYTEETGYQLKKKIGDAIEGNARKISEKENSVHKQLMELPWESILTTNYDYSLEYSADANFKSVRTTAERDYSFRRYQEAGDRRVYHIHGECDRPSSICLGFEHYAGMVEKMRGALVKSTEKELGNGHKFQLYDVLSGLTPLPEEWYYKLFLQDVYFLGFGFDSSEEDIWWMLSYRKRLMKEYPNLIQNRLYVLETAGEAKDENSKAKNLAKRKVMLAFGMEIIDCEGSTREQKYNRAIQILSEKLADENKEKTKWQSLDAKCAGET